MAQCGYGGARELAGLRADSTGLLADALDMLTDAGVYAIALAAIDRSTAFKACAAAVNGSLVLVLGLGVLAESDDGQFMVASRRVLG